MSGSDIAGLTLTAAVAALHSGKLGAREYAESLLSRARRYSQFNAFIHIDPEQVMRDAKTADSRRARGEPLGALHGVPLALKDNLNTAGVATTAGTPGLRGNIPQRNAVVVQSLLDAGAIAFGKANMHELAFGITSNNRAFGAARNPWDAQRIPGGSSGGTAAAVSARIVPAGIGSDTGGSVRVPAALCGIVGFRPTMGLWSQSGIVPISHTRDTAGPMTQTVADAMLLHSVVTGRPFPNSGASPGTRARASGELGPPISLQGLRLGVPRGHFWENLDSDTSRVCEAALTRLREAGAVLIEADIVDVARLDNAAGFPIALFEAVTDLNEYLRNQGLKFDFAELAAKCESPDVAGLLQSLCGAGAIPEAVYQQAMTVDRPALQAAYQRYFESQRVEAVLFPATPRTASMVGEDETVQLNGAAVSTFATFIRNSGPGSVAGIPGLSLPVGLSASRLPIGLELDGAAGTDVRLLEIGRAVEAVMTVLPAPV